MTLHIDPAALAQVITPEPADVSPLSTPAAPGSPLDLPKLGGAARVLVRTELPAVLSIGASGGAGTTTTVLGLAAAAATHADLESDPVAVDATAWGGDLAERGSDARQSTSDLQAWLNTKRPELPQAVVECTGTATSGARILSRSAEPLPRRETYASVHRHLERAGALPIYDADRVTNRSVAPLLADPRIAVALVTQARPDAINRLRPALGWLDDHFGEFLISRAVIVVSEQLPGAGTASADHVRTWLGTFVRDVVLIPFDPHLAAGGLFIWDQLATTTRAAYRQLLGVLQ